MLVKQWTKARSLTAVASILVKSALISTLAFPIVAPAAHAGVWNLPQEEEVTTLTTRVVALRRAIIGQESGANFRAVNPHSGALGYGQVMPENIPSWTYEALGYSVSAREFLNNPAIQLQVIDYKLNQYYQAALVASQGNDAIAIRRVAAQWYSGKPYRYTSTTPQFYNGHRYPSIAEYTISVLSRYQNQLTMMMMNPY